MSRQLVTLVLISALTGCAGQQDWPQDINPAPIPRPASPPPEVVPYGRYTLISTESTEAQRDLLAQIIDIRIPASLEPSVEDAMHHVLQRSGYVLCPASAGSRVLYSRPLPAAHYRLGPIRLREALEILAGPAWQLQVDQQQRQLCFQAAQRHSATETAPVEPSAQVYPAAPDQALEVRP